MEIEKAGGVAVLVLTFSVAKAPSVPPAAGTKKEIIHE